MKLLVFRTSAISADALYSDESLANLHRLMDGGCYGKLLPSELPARPALWQELQMRGKRIALIGVDLQGASDPHDALYDLAGSEPFVAAARAAGDEKIDYVEFWVPTTGASTAPSIEEIDQGLGLVLGGASEDVVILATSATVSKTEPGWFVLAASNNPLAGELDEVSADDAGATALLLAGLGAPLKMAGTALVDEETIRQSTAAKGGQQEVDEEDLVRRLRGLGYIE